MQRVAAPALLLLVLAVSPGTTYNEPEEPVPVLRRPLVVPPEGYPGSYGAGAASFVDAPADAFAQRQFSSPGMSASAAAAAAAVAAGDDGHYTHVIRQRKRQRKHHEMSQHYSYSGQQMLMGSHGRFIRDTSQTPRVAADASDDADAGSFEGLHGRRIGTPTATDFDEIDDVHAGAPPAGVLRGAAAAPRGERAAEKRARKESRAAFGPPHSASASADVAAAAAAAAGSHGDHAAHGGSTARGSGKGLTGVRRALEGAANDREGAYGRRAGGGTQTAGRPAIAGGGASAHGRRRPGPGGFPAGQALFREAGDFEGVYGPPTGVGTHAVGRYDSQVGIYDVGRAYSTLHRPVLYSDNRNAALGQGWDPMRRSKLIAGRQTDFDEMDDDGDRILVGSPPTFPHIFRATALGDAGKRSLRPADGTRGASRGPAGGAAGGGAAPVGRRDFSPFGHHQPQEAMYRDKHVYNTQDYTADAYDGTLQSGGGCDLWSVVWDTPVHLPENPRRMRQYLSRLLLRLYQALEELPLV